MSVEKAKRAEQTATMVAPLLPRVAAILLAVKSAALMPSVQTSVVKITKAVSVHTTIVSMNVPVMLTKACLTGSFVLAAAATIGAEPSPASLENKPRARRSEWQQQVLHRQNHLLLHVH